MKRWAASILVALVLGLPAPSAAQAAAAEAPRAVAGRILGALATRNSSAFAADMHPDALAAFKAGMTQVLRRATSDEDKAEAVKFFQGVGSFDQILALSPARFFQSYMGGVFMRMRQAGDVKVTYNILGEVPEGAQQVHVIYRGRVVAGERSASDVSILTLQRTTAGWKALLTDELRSLAGPGGAPGN